MKSVHYKHQGKRSNQEDNYELVENQLYVVCDGIGGHEKGEIASEFVVENTLNGFQSLERPINKEGIQNLLFEVQKGLNKKLDVMPKAERMGTTFCGVFIDEQSVHIAHIGDSRVYYIKPATGQIWHTWDHAPARNLVQMNEITREEGRLHPNASGIYKAIIANFNFKTEKADITRITELKEKDLFFICSDGIDDGWNEYELMKVLCDPTTGIEQKMKTVRELCAIESSDNNTAILIEVQKEDEMNNGANAELRWFTLADFEADHQMYLNKLATQENQEEEYFIEAEPLEETPVDHSVKILPIQEPDEAQQTKRNPYRLIVFVLLALLAALATFLVLKWKKGKKQEPLPSKNNIERIDNSGNTKVQKSTTNTIIVDKPTIEDPSDKQENKEPEKSDVVDPKIKAKLDSIKKDSDEENSLFTKATDSLSRKKYLDKYKNNKINQEHFDKVQEDYNKMIQK